MKLSSCKDTSRLLPMEAFSVYSSCMYEPTYEKYKSVMETFAKSASVKIFLYEDKDAIAGMLVLDNEGSIPEIVGIAVHEKYRQRGIGKRMIREMMSSEHLKSVSAQTDDDAIGFYRKCGFSEEKRIIEYPDGFATRYHCVLSR